jgi:hypothetical protein
LKTAGWRLSARGYGGTRLPKPLGFEFVTVAAGGPRAPPSPRWMGARSRLSTGKPPNNFSKNRPQRKALVPDITLQTLSATETTSLWGLSPYLTRWMLYHRFANGVDFSQGEDARMAWGKKLEPLVIAQATEELWPRVEPNRGQVYQRRGWLGCTRDATIFCPDRGRGALETKCVFDYATGMREWDGGRNVPPMHEIQLQQQMKVGDDSGPTSGVSSPSGSPAINIISSANPSTSFGGCWTRRWRLSSRRSYRNPSPIRPARR